MALIGGSSSSSQNYSNTETLESGADNGAAVNAVSGGSTLNVTDGRAIASMGDIAMAALGQQQQTEMAALAFSQTASNDALRFAYDAGRPEASSWNNTIMIAGAVVAVIAVAWVVTRK